MISVIVPVYNTEAYLVRCLDSLLMQTYPNLEILLIDDASTDKSGSICETYAARDSRLKVIRFPKNQGPSAARNAGIRKAEGKFISFVDADAYVEPDIMEKLYVALSENEADISICGADGIRIKDGAADTFSGTEAVRCLARGTPFNLVPWGKLYDAGLVRACPFDERIFYSEDLLFLYQYSGVSGRFAISRSNCTIMSTVRTVRFTAASVTGNVQRFLSIIESARMRLSIFRKCCLIFNRLHWIRIHVWPCLQWRQNCHVVSCLDT